MPATLTCGTCAYWRRTEDGVPLCREGGAAGFCYRSVTPALMWGNAPHECQEWRDRLLAPRCATCRWWTLSEIMSRLGWCRFVPENHRTSGRNGGLCNLYLYYDAPMGCQAMPDTFAKGVFNG